MENTTTEENVDELPPVEAYEDWDSEVLDILHWNYLNFNKAVLCLTVCTVSDRYMSGKTAGSATGRVGYIFLQRKHWRGTHE